MSREKLIEHLRLVSRSLERPLLYSAVEGADNEGYSLNYLYLATIAERMNVHVFENSKEFCTRLGVSRQEQLQDALLSFKPYFEAELTKKRVTSIVPCPGPWDYDPYFERTNEKDGKKFMRDLEGVQRSKGIFRAFLILRNWAFFPEEYKGSKKRSRMAANYLRVVIKHLKMKFKKDKKMGPFLKWGGTKTLKLIPWGFKEKELLKPPKSALPIYIDEAADYIRHFLRLACTQEGLADQHVEMVIFLSVSLAVARRRRGNYFTPADILKVTKNDIKNVQEITKRTRFGWALVMHCLLLVFLDLPYCNYSLKVI